MVSIRSCLADDSFSKTSGEDLRCFRHPRIFPKNVSFIWSKSISSIFNFEKFLASKEHFANLDDLLLGF